MKIIVTECSADSQEYVLTGKMAHKETIEFETREHAREYVRKRYEKVCNVVGKECGINEKTYQYDVKYGTCFAMVLSDKYIWEACVYIL